MSELLAWLILLPLAWAAIAFLIGPASGGPIAIVALAVQLGMSIRVGIAVETSGPQLHAVGGWGAPLGIDLFADGLAVAMILMIQVVALPVAVYARSYFDASAREARYFWPLTGFLVAGLNALVLSADLFNLYVALELIGLSAVGLVAAGGGAAQVNAALRYLIATLVASGAYLFGVALLYGVYGTVSTATLALLVSEDAPAIV
jgi:multicomponent Na+:H+ antiporter subunit D